MPAKIEANRGDVAEALMGAAVCATFATRPFTPITNAHIDLYLDKVLKQASLSDSFNVKNLKTKVEDRITFSISLPTKALVFIKDPFNRKLVKDLYVSTLSYVNRNRDLQTKAAELYKDNNHNDIIVSSAGTLNQRGTKADITIIIDGKPQTKQISLKVSGGDQFAQFSGANWDTQLSLFTVSLGLDITAAKDKFNKALESYDADARFIDRGKSTKDMMVYLKNAARISYTAATQSMKNEINNETFKSKLAQFIKKGATLNDPNIEIVKLAAGTAKSQSFGEKFISTVQSMNLSVSLSLMGDPKISLNAAVMGISGPLMSIRAKFEAPSNTTSSGKVYSTYMRNYIEAPTKSLLYII
jgi:hypothetical protein